MSLMFRATLLAVQSPDTDEVNPRDIGSQIMCMILVENEEATNSQISGA